MITRYFDARKNEWIDGPLPEPAKVQTRSDTSENLPAKPTGGPGTELTRILEAMGITSGAGCRCKEIARRMDREGPDWCEANIAGIAALMEEEAESRGWMRLLPFKQLGARALVRRAIAAARR